MVKRVEEETDDMHKTNGKVSTAQYSTVSTKKRYFDSGKKIIFVVLFDAVVHSFPPKYELK